MASYKVIIEKPAIEELFAIPFPFRRELNQHLMSLRENPRPKRHRPLDDGGLLLPLTGWAILYDVDDGTMTVTVLSFPKIPEGLT